MSVKYVYVDITSNACHARCIARQSYYILLCYTNHLEAWAKGDRKQKGFQKLHTKE